MSTTTYGEINEFKAQNGHCDVNTRYKANPTLGKWINNQREQYKIYLEVKNATADDDDDDDEAFAAAMMNVSIEIKNKITI